MRARSRGHLPARRREDHAVVQTKRSPAAPEPSDLPPPSIAAQLHAARRGHSLSAMGVGSPEHIQRAVESSLADGPTGIEGGVAGQVDAAEQGSAVSPELEAQIAQVHAGGGSPLPEAERAFFEERMGGDFSQVRIYDGPQAAQTAGRLNAHAFTVGSDIVFNTGEYQPGTNEGRHLLAHELAHTIQQTDGIATKRIQRLPLEEELDAQLDALEQEQTEPTAQPGTPPAQPPGATAEERRLDNPRASSFTQVAEFSAFFRTVQPALDPAKTVDEAEKLLIDLGKRLWQLATQRSQAGTGADRRDDRPLYWTRLSVTRLLHEWRPSFTLSETERDNLVTAFEHASRGMDTIDFTSTGQVKRILISGFDPFGFDPSALDQTINQSNPSGAIALAFDGQTIERNGVRAEIQSVIFPVRYDDFDEGIVEQVFSPYLGQQSSVAMIVTISQGGNSFEAEQYTGRRRSTPDSYPDNADRVLGASESNPIIPPGLENSPEFQQSRIPFQAGTNGQVALPGVPFRIDNTASWLAGTNTTLMSNQTTGAPPPGLGATSAGAAGQTRSVEGSGGGFLSNEVSYRANRVRNQSGATIPVWHLHTPAIRRDDDHSLRDTLITQTRAILELALDQL